jgi:G:T-mismatch repair DNA endonuclease (very short patch repair protein)
VAVAQTSIPAREQNTQRLRRLGWRVLVVRECQVRDQRPLMRKLAAFLTPNRAIQ